ncbi:MAG: hypothetical protein H5T97_07030 [Firmicutes bacterium]|nr:hypothetical protein [Bacillota bacterium]
MRRLTLLLTLALLLLPALALAAAGAAEAAELRAAIVQRPENAFDLGLQTRFYASQTGAEVPYAADLSFAAVVDGAAELDYATPERQKELGDFAFSRLPGSTMLTNITTGQVVKRWSNHGAWRADYGSGTGHGMDTYYLTDYFFSRAAEPVFRRGENRLKLEMDVLGKKVSYEFTLIVGQREVVPRVRVTAFARDNGLVEGRVECSHGPLGVNPERALADGHMCDLYLDGQKVRTLILRQDPDRANTAYAPFLLRAGRGIHTLRAVVR